MEIGIVLSALLLGLGTSLHCVGMCGPIALSLGIAGQKKAFHTQNLLYQLGRATTYAFLGLIIGLFSEVLQILIYQDTISILSGISIILMALFPFISNKWLAANGFLNRIIAPIKIRLSQNLQRKSLANRYLTGILNGFLPCGPVYMALAAAMGIGSGLESAFFMFLFGIGTLPLMFTLVYLGTKIQNPLRQKWYRWMPVLTIIIGLFFILRGLHLGIPFLSPPKKMLEQKIEKIQPQSILDIEGRGPAVVEEPADCH